MTAVTDATVRRLALLVLVVAVTAPVTAAGASAATGGGTRVVADRAPALAGGVRDGHGLHVTASAQVNRRLFSYTVSTSALPKVANVRVLLPSGYGAHPSRRYPVLYLLAGTNGRASDWVTRGGAEQTTAGRPVIVVMPDITLDGDGGGWCTNWVNNGRYGSPEWTTFHITQLIPWIDGNFRTIDNRGGRAIAGLSQGGFCSTSYAARYPDLFGTVSAYSGADDIASNAVIEGGVKGIVNATETLLDHVPATSMFGNPTTYRLNWSDHDPATLAVNLRNTNIYLYNGNGQPGPLTPAVTSSTNTESLVDADNQAFHQVLVADKIRSYWDAYGPGTHAWPYWVRDLKENLPAIMKGFSRPLVVPRSFTFKTTAARYSMFGWHVAVKRPASEFSTLEHATTSGFSLAGSGSAVVVTPNAYHAGSRYQVTIRGVNVHKNETVTAGSSGGLRLEVPLGPGNPDDEYSPASGPTGTHVFTTQVRIRATGS